MEKRLGKLAEITKEKTEMKMISKKLVIIKDRERIEGLHIDDWCL